MAPHGREARANGGPKNKDIEGQSRPPLWRQPANREDRRRRPCPGGERDGSVCELKKTTRSGEAGVELPGAKTGQRGDWRGETLAKVRRLIKQADPDAVEEVKWRKPTNPAGVSVWSHDGLVCTGETYKTHVKLTFFKGSQLKDPRRLFNAGLEGARRAIDLREGDELDEAAFKALVREAVALNRATR